MASLEPLIRHNSSSKAYARPKWCSTSIFHSNLCKRDAWKGLRPVIDLMTTQMWSKREFNISSITPSPSSNTTARLARSDGSTDQATSTISTRLPEKLSFLRWCSSLDQRHVERVQSQATWQAEQTCATLTISSGKRRLATRTLAMKKVARN